MSHPLEAAFLATRYRVRLDGSWIETRIGLAHPPLADWLGARGENVASLVSAGNPLGRPASTDDNAQREQALHDWLTLQGLEGLPAEGLSADGQWRESSLWVPGLGGARCRTVMQRFDQLAWVEYDSAGLARLRWTRDPISQD